MLWRSPERFLLGYSFCPFYCYRKVIKICKSANKSIWNVIYFVCYSHIQILLLFSVKSLWLLEFLFNAEKYKVCYIMRLVFIRLTFFTFCWKWADDCNLVISKRFPQVLISSDNFNYLERKFIPWTFTVHGMK